MTVAISVTLRGSEWGTNDGPVEGRFIYLPSRGDWTYQTLDPVKGYVSGKPPKRFFKRQRRDHQ